MASYIDRSLGDGEAIVARAHFPWLYGLAAWACFILPAFLLLASLSRALRQPVFMDPGDPASWAVWASSVVFLLFFFVFLKMMIRRATTEIGITSHRFVEKYGLITLRTNEIALHNIEGVRLNQSLGGRLFGYGIVRIEGTGVDAVTTPPIADPVGFVRAIQTAKEHEATR